MYCTFITVLLSLAAVHGSKQGRVIGGTDGDIANFPWMATLRQFDSQFCAGVLINDVNGAARYILTTVDCADFPADINDESVTVRMGNTIGQDGKQFFVENKTIHENFNDYEDGNRWPTRAHNIAVLKLNDTASGTNIQAATLAAADASYDDTQCSLAAWGRIDRNIEGLYPDTLQVATYTTISNTECNSTFAGLEEEIAFPVTDVIDEQMCAIDKTNDPPNVSGCDQDDGAALNCGASFNVVAGIMSFAVNEVDVAGDDCLAKAPNMYTRVSSYRTWITNNTP